MPATSDAPSVTDVLSALRRSHDRFVAAVSPLTDEQVSGPSYHEWTIAQVASHLGSGAEIFELMIEAGLAGAPAPGVEAFHPVWDSWNAKSPAEQAHDGLRADAEFLSRVDAMTADEQDSWHLDLFGSEQTLVGLLRMRLSEHAVHTWDIAVALDSAATVADDATLLIVDNLPAVAARGGKGSPQPLSARVGTTGPERAFRLDVTPDGVQLSEAAAAADADADASLRLPAEAFVRLVYGRLDPEHTPAAVEAVGVDLDALRVAFPGI
jgi:uncharacterized protein (TIGR03083 family)